MIIVTGMPRAGTTLMMHMIQSAGIPVYGHPDTMETENAILLPEQTDWLSEVEGAVKVLNIGKHYPPPGDYKLIWMKRDLDEQARSTKKYMEQLRHQPAMKGWKSRYKKRIMLGTREGLNKCRELGDTHIQRFEAVLDGNVTALADFLNVDSELLLKPIESRSHRCATDFLEKKYYSGVWK